MATLSSLLGTTYRGVPGPQGPEGPQGPQGPEGPAGSGGGETSDQFLLMGA